jgi:hypothetical protein
MLAAVFEASRRAIDEIGVFVRRVTNHFPASAPVSDAPPSELPRAP